MTTAEIRRALAAAKVRQVQVVRRGIGGAAPLVLVGEVADQRSKIEAALEPLGLRLGSYTGAGWRLLPALPKGGAA